ncbi:hypothetical protein ACP4OV_029160 [Aristida adscensionis]
MGSSTGEDGGGASVLLLPFPGAQGHLNPMLQFSRRLAAHGLVPTLVTTRRILATTAPPPSRTSSFRVAAISDGFDTGGAHASPHLPEYWRQLEAAGAEAQEGRPARVLVYDTHLPWARAVARAAGVAAAAFLTQPCAVELVYGELGPDDVPPFAAKPDMCPLFLEASVRQFEGLEDADDVIINSFHDIEPKEADYMELTWRAKTIGPTLPSFYLEDDDRLPSNNTYGFDLFSSTVSCMPWLDKQPPCSVVFASYGTFSDYNHAQLEELGNGLCSSGKPFLWVVRSNEEHKLSTELRVRSARSGALLFLGVPSLKF